MIYAREVPDIPLEALRYASLDVETTGTSPWTDEIVEIGIVLWKKGERTREFSTLVQARQPISAGAYAVHGIHPGMLEDAPTFEEIAPQILELLEDAVLVGHNIWGFDLGFVNRALMQAGFPPIYNLAIDTQGVVRRVFQGLGTRSLVGMARRLGVRVHTTHRALPDARTALSLWLNTLDALVRDGVVSLAEFHRRYIRPAREPVLRIMELARLKGRAKILYLSPFSGRTVREITPLGVRGRKIDAYCHLREDFRTFDVGRILKVIG